MAKLELSEMDRRQVAILVDLYQVRLLTGGQLERLHFAHLATPNARGSARRRTLGSLVSARLVTTLPRRIGGERAGSAGLVYTLDPQGQRLFANARVKGRRLRAPWPVGLPFVQHTLAVAELYVRLRELEARGTIRLVHFTAEPISWYRLTQGVLKPDAWAVFETAEWEEHWWLEVDRATESLPTVERKLRQYVLFAQSGQVGPLGMTPRVLLTVPSPERLTAVRQVIDSLPPPADLLIEVREFPNTFLPVTRPPP
jgi:Replication-relaxation